MARKEAYLLFVEEPEIAGTKTNAWSVRKNVVDEQCIFGYVKWYAQWRKYVFYPVVWSEQFLFDATCLQEIVDFLDDETNNHKQTWRKGKNDWN